MSRYTVVLTALALGLLLGACEDPECPVNTVKLGSRCHPCPEGTKASKYSCRAPDGGAVEPLDGEDAGGDFEFGRDAETLAPDGAASDPDASDASDGSDASVLCYGDGVDVDNSTCTAWQTCPAGHYVSRSGTSTMDRECSVCPQGQVSLGENAPACENAQIVAGEAHTCLLLTNGSVRCWGHGIAGQLGYGNTNNVGDVNTPASAGDVDVGGTVSQIAAGGGHTCALLTGGLVRCWGRGGHGQLGYGNFDAIGAQNTPASIGDVNVGVAVTQIAVGRSHTCALLTNGLVRCWGDSGQGQLGYGDPSLATRQSSPTSLGDVDVGGPAVQIATGAEHTCALLTSGRVRCWGAGASGQLGYGHPYIVGYDDSPSSAGDVDVGGTVVQIAAGGEHTCAILTSGRVRCWGNGGSGQLGYGNTNSVGSLLTPASAGDVHVGGTAVSQVSTGYFHTCALLTDRSVRCWGLNSYGQLGYGNTERIGDRQAPALAGQVEVGGTVSQIAAGGMHTCALLTDGRVRCWGGSSHGQLGYGNTYSVGDQNTPASAGDVPYL